MTLQRGETLLVTLGIPVVLLIFFTLVPVRRLALDIVSTSLPRILALAVMSTAMVSLGSRPPSNAATES